MGSLKQLLPFNQGTLLSNAVAQAKDAGFDRIVVVVGAQADRVAAAVSHQHVEIVENSDWESGMGSSIRAGMKHIRECRSLPNLLAILLADQPLVQSSHLLAMRERQADLHAPIVAAEYEGRCGVPALFTQDLFPLLETLAPEAGAKNLLREGAFPVMAFPLPEAATDVDTPGDFTALQAVRP